MLPEEAREYLGDWYEIAGPALGIADPGERQADPQGCATAWSPPAAPAGPPRWPLVLLIDDAHWADQGDPALARRARRTARRDLGA